jgi:hypothetical protein
MPKTRAQKKLRMFGLKEQAKKPVLLKQSLNNPFSFLSQTVNEFLTKDEVARTTALLNHKWGEAARQHPSLIFNRPPHSSLAFNVAINRMPKSYAAWEREVESQSEAWKKRVTHFTLHGILPSADWSEFESPETQRFTGKHFALLVQHFPNLQFVDIEVDIGWRKPLFPYNVCEYLAKLPRLTHLRLHGHHNFVIHRDALQAIATMKELRFLSLGVANPDDVSDEWKPAEAVDFGLLSKLPHLETLEIIGTRQGEGNYSTSISTAPDAEETEMLYDSSILTHLEKIPRLTTFVTDVIAMDEISLETLQKFGSLRELSIRVKGVTPKGLSLLAALVQLTSLRLEQYYCENREDELLSDQDLTALRQLTSLRSLSVGIYLTSQFDHDKIRPDEAYHLEQYRDRYENLNSRLPRGRFLTALDTLINLQIFKFTVGPVRYNPSIQPVVDAESVKIFLNTRRSRPLVLCEINGVSCDPRLLQNRAGFFQSFARQDQNPENGTPASSLNMDCS